MQAINLVVIICFLTFFKDVAAACPKGDKAFELLQYSKAILEYEKCLSLTPDNLVALERLADSYLILDNSLKAEEIYRKLAVKEKVYSPVVLKYVNAMYLNNKLMFYQSTLDSLLQRYPKQKDILKLKNFNKFHEKTSYTISTVSFNAPEADFSPIFYADKIVFSSTRIGNKKNDLFTGQGYSQLYSFDTLAGVISPFIPDINLKFNVGSCVFFDNGKKMMFAANDKSTVVKNTYLLKLYITELKNGVWSKPVLFEHNRLKSNNTHPAINPSANLLVFASDGYSNSGMDLYLSVKDRSGNWKLPTRLKSSINSNGNEVFPVFLNDSTMIFSSDGLQSLGKGLDLYKTVFRNGTCSIPILLDAPFNSVSDDYGLCSIDNMKSGYFTSNRNNPEGNEDIYHFRLDKIDSLIVNDSFIVADVIETTLKGKISEDEGGGPIENATISFYNDEGVIVAEAITNDQGRFDVKIPKVKLVIYKIEKTGYFFESGSFLLEDSPHNPDDNLEIKLRSLKKDDVFILKNIYYDFDKWDILPESKTELNNLYNFLTLHPSMKVELSSHTDASGKDSYNMLLSAKRAEAAVTYLTELGISKDRISAQGYGETKLINHCKNGIFCTDDEHRKNRRTEVKILTLN